MFQDRIQPKTTHIPWKEVFANKRMRFFMAIVALLWIAVGTQYIARRFFFKEGDILSAFVATNSGLIESTMESTAEYGSQYLTVEDKKALITYVANGLGIITNDDEYDMYEKENCQELVYTKEAARAVTVIKVVTLNLKDSTDAFVQTEEKSNPVTQYIMVKIRIYEDANNDILTLKEKVQDIYDNLKIPDERVSETLQLCGSFSGNLLLDTKNKLADEMIDSLDGKVVFENRENELYTIYAYTGLLREYITVNESRINIQVAMTYDEKENCTKIYLATPIISGDW